MICNFTINRDHSRETRIVIYACKNSSGHLNPYNSANGLNYGLNCPPEYLGKHGNKPRLIKVSLSSIIEERRMILASQFFNLRNKEHPS